MEKTIKNLAVAFIGESQARNRYHYYNKVAKNEGYEQLASIFTETADQEKEHASQIFKMIQTLKEKGKDNNDEIKIEAGVPTVLGTTAENLKAAIAGENHEHTTMYPEFAQTADEEGLKEIADQLRAIGKAEEHHQERYQKLLNEIEAGTIFKKEKEVAWVCRECGYVHVGTEPPEVCPSCKHAKAYYQLKCEEY
ncbi:rubrerythrin family protein [Patescibacteria group bacterium]|nr:rubrerythrin family protein [Patescibacteria group bacterium]MBU1890254.1 rubrerythrin family protein [Patescibacteria group bacterium]